MNITSYSNFRQNLKTHLDNMVEESAPLYVTRNKAEDVVVMSKSDYEGLKETLYLLSSPKNAERIYHAIDEYNKGKSVVRELIEE